MKWGDNYEKYKNGKIYVIKNKNNENFFYLGSTYRDLEVRFKEHKSKIASYNVCLFNYVRKFFLNDWSSFYIELYMIFPCSSRSELIFKETELILKLKPFNHPTNIDIYMFNNTLKKKNVKISDDKINLLKNHERILKSLEYDDDNDVLCPFCKYHFKFYNVSNHIKSINHKFYI